MTDYDPVQKENVLLVDDTPANLEILIKMLQREGYKVRAVNSGMMALNAAGLEAPDIFLLDVNMPGMNGYETCRKLKESERFRSIPVIFISALSEVFDKVAAFESGGVDFITKPFQFEEVIARVRTHLELRRYQNLLEQKNKELKEALDRLNETQGQLINSEKMASLGVLTAGIAHEFNNPISFIHTSSLGLGNDVKFFLGMQQRYEEILTRCDPAALEELRQIKSEEEYDERLEEMKTLSKNIITGSQRITGIVKSLRLFARLDEADKKPINLRETIESTLLLLQHKLSDKISVTGEYGEVPDVICYPAKISQVFMNILSNAIDAIDAKRNPDPTEQIMISTSQKLISGLDYVIATVSDSGCGIPQDTIKKVFDPFFTTKPVGRGMGLGLSISNNIVKEHGGNIEITSREGKGTSVSVYLPAKFEIT